jgi:hypothetical protein
MPKPGIRRTIRLGGTYHTIYLFHQYHGTDYEPYLSPNKEDIMQLCVALQHQYTHTLVLILSDVQVHACFPARRRPSAVTLESPGAAAENGNSR